MEEYGHARRDQSPFEGAAMNDPRDVDRGLMRRVAAGDDAAFTTLVERWGARLLAVARRLLASPADAEDAVQRALLQCHRHARAYRPEWAVSTWLYRIVTNVCVDELRRAARSTRHLERLRAEPSASAGDAASARVDLGRALARLPREARILVVLRYVDDLSVGELARIRGISVNTVKSQLARGKRLLRAALAEGGSHGSRSTR